MNRNVKTGLILAPEERHINDYKKSLSGKGAEKSLSGGPKYQG
jgi:hypothetical protein